jgi:REP element-mobilizing transposase RayT
MWKWNRRDPFLENNYYHIYNRWYNKSILFKDDHSFEKFFKYLVRYSNEFTEELKLISYSFLPNHFHLIIKNLDGTGTQISKFMKKLQWAYSVWFRVRYPLEDIQGTGTQLKLPVFEWRFKAKIIDNDEYLEHCLAYVNLNPLKHNIVDNIDNYKWTSYHNINKKEVDIYKDFILKELEF